jgi:CAAX amino terminal protease family.
MKNLRDCFSKNVLFFAALLSLLLFLTDGIIGDSDPISSNVASLKRALTTLLGIAIIRMMDLWETAGFVRKNYINGIILGLPLLVLGFASALPGMSKSIPDFLGIQNALVYTFNMFLVGLSEETIYRGLIFNNMLRRWKSDNNGMQKAVIWSAVVFGAAHLTNAFHAPVLTVAVQAINAMSAGLLFAVIFVKCKNIWALVTVHMMADWIALFAQQCFTQGESIISLEFSPVLALVTIAAGSGVPIVFSYIYLRSIKNEGKAAASKA